MVFSPVPFQSDLFMPQLEEATEKESNDAVRETSFAGLKASVAESIRRIFQPNDVSSLVSITF